MAISPNLFSVFSMNPSKMGIKSFPQFKKKLFNPIHYIIIVLLVSFTFTGYSQKNKNGGYGKRNKDIIPVIECVKDLRNGLYQATFGYKNPRNKEVVIDENGSIIKWKAAEIKIKLGTPGAYAVEK